MFTHNNTHSTVITVINTTQRVVSVATVPFIQLYIETDTVQVLSLHNGILQMYNVHVLLPCGPVARTHSANKQSGLES